MLYVWAQSWPRPWNDRTTWRHCRWRLPGVDLGGGRANSAPHPFVAATVDFDNTAFYVSSQCPYEPVDNNLCSKFITIFPVCCRSIRISDIQKGPKLRAIVMLHNNSLARSFRPISKNVSTHFCCSISSNSSAELQYLCGHLCSPKSSENVTSESAGISRHSMFTTALV